MRYGKNSKLDWSGHLGYRAPHRDYSQNHLDSGSQNGWFLQKKTGADIYPVQAESKNGCTGYC